jgi:hypothetical protein
MKSGEVMLAYSELKLHSEQTSLSLTKANQEYVKNRVLRRIFGPKRDEVTGKC